MDYIDQNGSLQREQGAQDRLLLALYTKNWGRALVRLLVRPGISRAAGKLLDTRVSRCLIGPFIRLNHLDMGPYRRRSPEEFASYNDFFTREISPGMRPLDEAENHLIAPCDGRVTVYPIGGDTSFHVKHTCYTAESLLKSRKLAERYRGGFAVVLRLCVTDYHRYIYPVTGEKSDNYRIPGVFHTVNPVAVETAEAFKENTREFTLIKSEKFGTVLQMEVGALMVGRICNHHPAGSVIRGQEKGMFEFGGSTVILLLERGRVSIRQDLLENTRRGAETQVLMGSCIGTAKEKHSRRIFWEDETE